MNKQVTVVLTACNRPDLLRRTLDSFFQMNTYPIERFIIVDDGMVPGCNDFVKDYNKDIELIYNPVKLGQIRTIDLVYSTIKTPYIFHMEEDWLFLLPNFIEKSMEVMDKDKKIVTVWLRSPKDSTLQHPYSKETYATENGIEYKVCEVLLPKGGIWNGFTFNPALKRLIDYDRVKPYQFLPRITPPQQSGGHPLECDISVAYAQLGYYAVTLLDQYIEHIGWDRHLV